MRRNHIPEIVLAVTSLIFAPIVGQLLDNPTMDDNSGRLLDNATMDDNSGRIVGGKPAAQEDTKYQASIRLVDYETNALGSGYICSGALITPKVVLSIASCYLDDKLSDLVVVMGNVQLTDKAHTVTFKLDRVVKHPDSWNDEGLTDLALLFLADSVKKDNEYIAPIQTNRQPLTAETRCKVTGWGYTERIEESLNPQKSNKLLTADIEVMPALAPKCKLSVNEAIDGARTSLRGKYNDTEIEDILEDVIELSQKALRQGLLCGGDAVIQGWALDLDDGGALLVCDGLLVGLAISHDWSNFSLPGFYVEAAYYQKWIDKEIRKDQRRKRSGSVKVSSSLILVIGSIVCSWT